MKNETLNQIPPPALIRTWYMLLMNKESSEAKQQAAKMLIKTFGDIKSAIAYLKEQGIVN